MCDALSSIVFWEQSMFAVTQLLEGNSCIPSKHDVYSTHFSSEVRGHEWMTLICDKTDSRIFL